MGGSASIFSANEFASRPAPTTTKAVATQQSNNRLAVITEVERPKSSVKKITVESASKDWGPLANTEFKFLFQRLNLRGLMLKNRFVLAPMTRRRAGSSWLANDLMRDYYAQFNSSGLEITEGVFISEEARGRAACAGIWTEEQALKWKVVTDAVHAKGGVIFIQLLHQGRQSHSSFNNGKLPVAPSPIKMDADYYTIQGQKVASEVPHELSLSDIKRLLGDYREAARLSKLAGFDGVEIGAGYGFLLDQFLQSKTNQRSDAYGGSVDKRFKFVGEVIDVVAEVFGKDRVGIRYTPNSPAGEIASSDYRQTFKYAIEATGAKGIAYVHVVDGVSYGFHALGEPFTLREARKVLPQAVALIGNCGYTPESANDRIESGDADMISFGRHYLGNPDLPERVSHGWPLAEAPARSFWNTPNETYMTPQGYIMPCFNPKDCELPSTTS